MAPGAVLPDSASSSPAGETANGFMNSYWSRLRGAAARLNTNINTASSTSSASSQPDSNSNGQSNGNANGGGVNGYINGHENGPVNGQTNGYTNGHVNGALNGLLNGHDSPPGRHLNGVNGVNGVNSVNGIHNVNGSGSTAPNGAANGATSGNAAPAAGKPMPMPIAIVGIACRMPGNVASPAEFWELLSRSRSGFSEIPKERFDPSSFYHPNAGKGGCYNPVGGNFLKCDLQAFDAPFFSLTEKEAISMDPQQRLLLECTFEALENAGVPKHQIVGKDVGVFVGGSFPEYESHLFRDSDTIPMHQATGCAYAMQSNRISHFFDLRGPSFTSDTACSSSMVAVHLACQSLRAGESSVALVGGCHLNMLPEFWISFSTCRLLSDSGRSIAFDSRGTGFGRGEGCAMLVLKPLDQALKDNDAIRAVIVGTGINQDGKTPGITMPNGDAQEALMQQVYRQYGLNPKECGFVEAHGTGTKVGDPIEATAIHKVLGKGRTLRDPLYIGSVKSNIGHLEGASGIAGIVKAALMLERSFILPNHDFKSPNPKIPWKEWHLKVPVMQRPWPRGKKYISVNNFGFGGTNGHVVLEAAPYRQKQDISAELVEKQHKIFVFSANDKSSLATVMKNAVIYLEQRPEIFEMALMYNLAYTLGQRRSLLQWRAAIHAKDSFELIEALNAQKAVVHKELECLRIGYIFTGQGAQWWAMGRELYDQYPVFTNSIDRADRCLVGLGADWSLVEELARDEKSTHVSEAHISQPSCTAIQLALVDLLSSWGVKPTAVAGHSSGEIGAAYAAGIITFESAMMIAYHRGRLIPILKKRFPDLRGRMMAVGGSKDDIQPLIDGLREKEVRIACFNSPSSLTISGDEPALAELEKIVEEKQMFNRRLMIDTAYHSHHMNLVAKEYRAVLASLPDPVASDVAFHSSLYGVLVHGTELQANYWVENLTCPVRFSEAVESMMQPVGDFKTGVNSLVELGPHSALQGPIKQILKTVGGPAAKVPYDSALIRKKDAVETAMDLAVSLFTKGANLEFENVNFPKPGKNPSLLTDMPRYPWNYQTKYWQESRMTMRHKHRSHPRSDILGVEAIYSNDLEPTWRNIVRLDDLPWLRQHKIQSLTMYPMSAFIVMALEAAAQRAASKDRRVDRFELKDVSIVKPLVIPDEDIEITTALRPHQEGTLVSSDVWDEFRICSYSHNGGWTEHCIGLVATQTDETNDVDGSRQAMNYQSLLRSTAAAVKASGPCEVKVGELYDAMAEVGIVFGPAFQGIRSCEASETHSGGNISVEDFSKEMPNEYLVSPVIHPCLLESLISMYWPVLGAGKPTPATVYLPSAVERISIAAKAVELCRQPGQSLQAYCSTGFARGAPKPTKISTIATSGADATEPLITLEGLLVAPIIDGETELDLNAPRELCYKMNWEPILEPLHGTQQAEGPNGVPATNGVATSDSFPDLPIAIIHGNSSAQSLTAVGLMVAIEHATGKMPEAGTLGEVSTEGKTLVFLSELHQPMLPTLTATQFGQLQKALTSAEGCLWVVRGAYDKSTDPEANMVSGLSRAIRSESAMKFATLDLDGRTQLSEEQVTEAILKVFTAAFGPNTSSTSELEFMERGGSFFTPRIVNDKEMNGYVQQQINPSLLEDALFSGEGRYLKMALTTPGALDTLHFIDNPVMTDQIAEDEVEIDVKAIGMSFRDIMAAKGQVEDEFGFEVSGVISAVGTNVAGLQPGDRVAALTQGGYASKVRANAPSVFKIPEMSFEAAATIPLAYCTAYYSLIELGRLEQGESLLIHAAAGPVGQAAICLAQTIGAEIFATVSTAEKKELLMREFSIPEDRIFYSRNTTFGSAIRQATAGQGVEMVLNSATGDALRESWECLSKFGRFLDIGKRDAHHKTRLEMAHNNNNASFISVDIFAVAAERPKVIKRLVADIAGLVESGKIRPVSPVTVFPISGVEAAFKTLQTAKSPGKLVVVPQPGEVIKATRSKKTKAFLRSNATYILIGGTGGLGRSMARWMVSNGARHIALVSRSGSATGKVKELIDDLREDGAQVVVRKCNVVNKTEVEDLISNGLQGLPSVRGVVHGTMVLHDVLFEKMTWEDYATVIEGKVQGAWNFHNALAGVPLDFFVAISSAAGAVGNRGQAAYAAANCFLNAFVQYRLARGLPASSLDLTMVSDSGYLADNTEKLAEVARNLGSDSICESEVLALLGAAISGKLAETCNNHTITGMRITPTMQPFWTLDAKFKHLRLAVEAAAAEDATANAGAVSFGAALKAAKSLEEAEAVVCSGLVDKISTVLMIEAEELDVTRSLSHYPLDSLVAIEIRNFIAREFEANMQVLELLSSGSTQTLAKAVCAKSKLVSFA